MPFQPKSNKHAIVEVVFGLVFTRPFHPKEIKALVESHGRWKELLPRRGRTSPFPVPFMQGDELPPNFPIPLPPSGVTFDRVKPDGSLDWRLRADDAGITVNCLSYTTWPEIYGRARELLSQACEVAVRSDNSIRETFLQYIDVFEWEGEKQAYDLAELLRADSPYVPPSIRQRGPLWHLHQGFFRTEGLPSPGRLLERNHADGYQDQSGAALVKIDEYLSLHHLAPLAPSVLFGPRGSADTLFGYLHDLNKDILRHYLTDKMQARIGLNG